MKRFPDSVDRLSVKNLTLDSRHGSVRLSISNDGKIVFKPVSNSQTGSFSIDLKNEKISIKNIEFGDNSSLSTATNIGSGGSSGVGTKFDPSTGRLIEDFLPVDFNNIRQNANDAIGKFDASTGLLRDAKINPDILADITKGVSANNKFDINGKLSSSNLHSDIINDIDKGIAANNKFDINGKLPSNNLHSDIVSDISKGISAHDDIGNLDFSIDNSIPDSPIIKISRGSRGLSSINVSKTNIGLSNVENKNSAAIRSEITIDADGALQGIGSGIGSKVSNSKITVDATTGKLIGIGTNDIVVNNEHAFNDTRFTSVQSNALNGKQAHDDLNQADISVDATGKIQFNRGGSRGSSTGTTITKSHVGLGLAENKSAATIVSETFTDSRFINVSASARDGFASGSQARGFFDSSATPQIKDANTPSGLKNSNITVDSATGKLVGIGTADIIVNNEKTFADTRFTTVSGNTNTVYNRFDNTTGRLLEDNSLNKRPVVIQYGSAMPSNPQVGDLVTVIGDSDFIGTTYIYGSREYDLANIPSDNLFKSGLILNKTTNWNSYLDPYFTKDGSTTGQIKFQYDSTEDDYSLFITPNTSLTSIDRFYGETKFTVRYIPVTGSSFFTSNYVATDQGTAGASGDPAIFFKIEDTTNSFTAVSVFDATNDAALGTSISDFDGTYSIIFKGSLNTKKYKFKTFYHIANNNKFYRYAITHNNITDATTTRRILIEKITIEGWVPYDDTGVKSRLYELAQKTGKTFDTFTGQHKCTIEQEQDINLYKTGLIVSSIGTYNNMNYENNELQNKITPQEAVPVVTLCKKEKDKSVIGVICKEWEMAKYNNKNFKADGFVVNKDSYVTRLEINSLGEGGVWVCNINGNLENGDYITTCQIPGYGMKQDDDLLHNYTVAKITCDCNFDLNSPIYACEEFEYQGKTYRKAYVGCTYHCG